MPVAGGFHLGLYFVETEQIRYVRLGALRLDLDQLVGACFRQKGSAICVIFEYCIGMPILCVGA